MNQYDIFILLEDLNPLIKQGAKGVILEIYDLKEIEVEFVREDGSNIEYEGQGTFQINPEIIRVKTAYNKR